VADAATRTYKRTDARTAVFTSPDDPFASRIPGVANEYWPLSNVRPGGENYGWGATLPMLIIRNIIGFRETPGGATDKFLLAPCLPAGLGETLEEKSGAVSAIGASQAGSASPSKAFGIKNLKFGGLLYDLDVARLGGDSLAITLVPRKGYGGTLHVLRDDGVQRIEMGRWQGNEEMKGTTGMQWEGKNGATYTVELGS
jgi:hypothetical protein